MDLLDKILFGVFELVALVIVVRLWASRRTELIPRLLWSVVLLVPCFGLMAYIFLYENPESHSERPGDSGYGGSDSGGGHGGHDGGGHA